MWIGIDDTDSPQGGCTTYVAFELITALQRQGYWVCGFPRLVRLNPNIPWKTRGNGAVAFQVSTKGKNQVILGKKNSEKIIGCKNTDCHEEMNAIQRNEIISIIEKVIDSCAELKGKNTNPGFVIINQQLDESWYQKAVKGIVELDEITHFLLHNDIFFKKYDLGRGLIGATAAISWNPSLDRTFELISYRKKKFWGSKRRIDEQSVIAVDNKNSTIFDCYDYRNNKVCIAPHSPCPVLFGIRGTDELCLPRCYKDLKAEENQGWLLFESNQATDDQFITSSIAYLQPYQSVIMQGTVEKNPSDFPGGHVVFTLKDAEKHAIDCIAYEPTKQFRGIIRKLRVNDEIIVFGGVRNHPLTVNIEKIKIVKLSKRIEKINNPICPECGKHMKSKGKDKGYRCKRCKTESMYPITRERKRVLQPGWYEVPVVARRHLTKPVSLLKK